MVAEPIDFYLELASPYGYLASSQIEVKDRLTAQTQAAIERGVFGSPVLLAGDEPFRGADRLDQVERWLAAGW